MLFLTKPGPKCADFSFNGHKIQHVEKKNTEVTGAKKIT